MYLQHLTKSIVIIFFLLSLLFSLASTSNQNQNSDSESDSIEKLFFQKSHIVQVLPGITKKLQINRSQILKYVNPQNEDKIMRSFSLQYQNFVRIGEIFVSIFLNKTDIKNDKAQVFDLNKDKNGQESTIFHLNFLKNYNLNDIHKIQIDIRSNKFSVVSLALINNQISDEINLIQIQKKGSSFGKIPIWMPFSYNHQKNKFKQIIKYFYFKAGQTKTKLRISRIKGHPKIFLYNCDASKMSFCIEQIDEEHIDGQLMFQKQLLISLQKEANCKDCSIILAIKNMGAQTKMQITEHTGEDKLVVSKDNPIYYKLKGKQSLLITSYFTLPSSIKNDYLFLDVSIVEGNSSSMSIESIQIDSFYEQFFQKESSKNSLSKLSSSDFIFENQTKAIRIKLNRTVQISNYEISKDSNNETWYKITFKFVAKNHIQFTVVDRNIPHDEQNFINLKDGQLFHSYIFSGKQVPSSDDSNLKSVLQQNFKVKVTSISTISISSQCSEINKMLVQFYPKLNKQMENKHQLTKISPKIFVQNITHHNKKCSQLIHLNPIQLFGNYPVHNKTMDKQEDQNSGWVYFTVSGIKTQVDLLYSSSDIIILQKQFPYHSQLQYNQGLYFYVANIQHQARIKIQKCSDCQISVSFSEQQLSDTSQKREYQIISKEVQFISNVYSHRMKHNVGLFVRVKTNNFAHFVISVQEILQSDKETVQLENGMFETQNKIKFSLKQDNKLVLQFSPPNFIYTNNLNSPTYFSLIQGSINVQVARETYCPEFIFSQKQRTRDVSITLIVPQLVQDEQGNQKFTYTMELKHHNFFGIRAQKGNQIFSYKITNIESMKQWAQYRWSLFNVLLFITFALFMSFVCFMGLKKKKIKKIGGEVVQQSQDGEETSMVRLN